MLDYLQIKNFTIIENESVEFHPGLSIITGESGSGKSLILDAIYLILGSRTSIDIIRPENEKCDLVAQFNITNNKAAKLWLQSTEIDDSECIITRKFHKNKPGKCYINGQLLTQKQLKEFASHLVYIHSQNENYQICGPGYQLTLLDDYACSHTTVAKVRASYQKLVAIIQEINSLTAVVATQHDKLAMLDYYLEELYEHTQDDEPFETLEHNYKRMSKSINYQELLQETESVISGDSALSNLSRLLAKFEQYKHTFPETLNIINLIQETTTNLEEVQQEIKANFSSSDDHEDKQQKLEIKISKCYDLARKHNTNPNNLINIITELEQNKASIIAAQDDLAEKKQQQAAEVIIYDDLSSKLHQERAEAALKLEKEIKAILPKLGMPHGKININVAYNEESQKSTGKDDICFMFSANLGHELERLQDIASGGEISRISMILELLTNKENHSTALIFDEVDTGVSGKIARDIGVILKQLSNNCQVIAITHSPQIASLANNNYKITKITENKKTYSKITHLSNKEKINEIAALISDGSLNDNAINQAKILCEDDA
tara:strand:+ start:50 stop:1705 length:1656 start_codon:yes stop_codon:yes gene_type:complete